MFTIKNERKTDYENLGRNGFFKAGGVEVTPLTGTGVGKSELWLEPLTGKGDVGKARIVLNPEAIPALIKVLRKAQDILDEKCSAEMPMLDGSFLSVRRMERVLPAETPFAIYHAPASGGGLETVGDWLREQDGSPLAFATMAQAVDRVREMQRQDYQERGRKLQQERA